jgi:hypothetical protein
VVMTHKIKIVDSTTKNYELWWINLANQHLHASLSMNEDSKFRSFYSRVNLVLMNYQATLHNEDLGVCIEFETSEDMMAFILEWS